MHVDLQWSAVLQQSSLTSVTGNDASNSVIKMAVRVTAMHVELQRRAILQQTTVKHAMH